METKDYDPGQHVVFETERLVASLWSEQLADQAFRIYGDPDVTRLIGDGISESSVESMRDRISFIIQRNQKWPQRWGSWPVFLKSSLQLVGTLLMKPLPDTDGNDTQAVEIGWHLMRNQWGKGFVTEGTSKLVEFGFAVDSVTELWAVTEPRNQRSQAVANRIGMKHVGQTNRYYQGQTLELFRIQNPACERNSGR